MTEYSCRAVLSQKHPGKVCTEGPDAQSLSPFPAAADDDDGKRGRLKACGSLVQHLSARVAAQLQDPSLCHLSSGIMVILQTSNTKDGNCMVLWFRFSAPRTVLS